MRGKNLSEIIQLKMNIFLYLTIGWWFARIYICMLGNFYFCLHKEEKKKIVDSVKNIINRGRKDIDNTAILYKKVFNGIFAHYYEKLYIAFEKQQKAKRFMERHIKSNDIIVLRRALLKGKGVIFITGHYGAIEYIPTLLAVNDINVSMIAKFKTPQLKKRVFEQAAKYGIQIIDGDETGNVFKQAIDALRENHVLVTQCDEIDEWRASDKINITFLGQITGLDRTINILLRRSGAEAVFGVVHRFNFSKYSFAAYSHEDMAKIVPFKSTTTTGELVLKMLEHLICLHPEQWYQWKKYSTLGSLCRSTKNADRPIALPHTKPTFDNTL